MQRTFLAIAAATALAGASLAFDPPRWGKQAPQGAQQQQGGQGAKAGKRGGKKLGPQDGSGPIHTPGTGGGTGAGKRGPRR